jgi:hypothetical protein
MWTAPGTGDFRSQQNIPPRLRFALDERKTYRADPCYRPFLRLGRKGEPLGIHAQRIDRKPPLFRKLDCFSDDQPNPVWDSKVFRLSWRCPVIRIAPPFASGCLLGLLLLAPIERVFGKIVLVGDAYVDDKAAQFVVYYKSIPGVANPGQRKHVCDSFDELKDELRRAKNNGWEIDFKRSYMSYIILAGVNDDDPPRRPFVPAMPSVANTKWKSPKGYQLWKLGLPTNRIVGAFGAPYFIEFKSGGAYRVTNSRGVTLDGSRIEAWDGKWSQSRNRVTLLDGVAGRFTYVVNGDKIRLIDGGVDGVESPWLTRVK